MADCDNHPGVEAVTYTGWRAYEINLCDVCTPPWFLDLDEDDPEIEHDGGSPEWPRAAVTEGGTL